MWLLVVPFAAATVVLLAYGLNFWYLLYLYRTRRPGGEPPPPPSSLPRVTVQLPIYNELHVVERLLNAVAALDYPGELLEIQVLDDSTDQTTATVARLTEQHRRRGLCIAHLHRPHRRGFKAGALQAGLLAAGGELIAVFDADFVPRPDFLRRMVPYFGDARVAMAQARWGHLNRDHSPLTRAQALGLDGFFLVGQRALSDGGYFTQFNGTAGVWRASAIRDAGGWLDRTLTEDRDLSFRAQLRGWRLVQVDEPMSAGELPTRMDDLRHQQRRWNKGATEAALLLTGPLLRSRATPGQKLLGLLNLYGGSTCLAMAVSAGCSLPLVVAGAGAGRLRTALLVLTLAQLATFGGYLAYVACGQRRLEGSWLARMLYFPLLSASLQGLSLSNARAVLEALLRRRSEFVRTPKHALTAASPAPPRSAAYRSPAAPMAAAELLASGYCLAAMYLAVASRQYFFLPILAPFALGFFLVGACSVLEHARGRAVAEPAAAPGAVPGLAAGLRRVQ